VQPDGPSAMMMMRSGRPPDLVILDLALPYLSGQSILSEIRRDEARVSDPGVRKRR
jgi:CheY-like chemotaxis protein